MLLFATTAFAFEKEALPPGIDLGDLGDPIINGQPAAAEDWPMTGGLIVHAQATVAGFGDVTARALMCSSTLIAPDVVLTAAHCIDIDGLVDQASASGVTIQSLSNLQIGWSRRADLYQYDLAGSAVNGVVDWPEDTAFAASWMAHPGFDLFTLQVGLAENQDIGLIFLEEPVFDVPFALLPTAEEAAAIAVGDIVTIVGWGQQQQDALPGTVGEKQMTESSIDKLADYEFQVGEAYESGRKCHGDSGGPTFLDVTTDSAVTSRLVGVTSHAYDTTDCRVTGGVDTRVDHYLAWIDGRLRDGCADGTRAWCEEEGIPAPPDANGDFWWELVAADEGVVEEGKAGCGCAGGGAAPLWLLAPAALLLRRRRRQ